MPAENPTLQMPVRPAAISAGGRGQQAPSQSPSPLSLGQRSRFFSHYFARRDYKPWPAGRERRRPYEWGVVLNATEHDLAHSLTWFIEDMAGTNPVLDSDLGRSAYDPETRSEERRVGRQCGGRV